MKKFLSLLVIGLLTSIILITHAVAQSGSSVQAESSHKEVVRLYAECTRGGVLKNKLYRTNLKMVRPFSKDESFYDLSVHQIRYNPTSSPLFQIYIGLPAGTAPDNRGPYYVGHLALYALNQNGTFRLVITDTIRYLKSQGLLNGKSISVTFVPVAGETDGDPIQFRRITITGQSD
jgi:hypothetical protein